MKKIMMIAAMMLLSVGAFAQNEVGQITLKPTAGINLASITDSNDPKMRIGLIAGVEAEYGVAENFGITAGVFYSQQGVKFDGKESSTLYADGQLIGGTTFEGKATYKLDYINVPIMAQFYPVKGLAIKAGVQPGFNVLKKVHRDGTWTTAGVLGGNKQTVDEDYDIEDGVKGFNLSIPMGLSYEISDFVIDARYNLGVTKVFDDGDNKHSVFTFTLGYKFAL